MCTVPDCCWKLVKVKLHYMARTLILLTGIRCFCLMMVMVTRETRMSAANRILGEAAQAIMDQLRGFEHCCPLCSIQKCYKHFPLFL